MRKKRKPAKNQIPVSYPVPSVFPSIPGMWIHEMTHRGWKLILSSVGLTLCDGVGTYTSRDLKSPAEIPDEAGFLKLADQLVDEYEAWVKRAPK